MYSSYPKRKSKTNNRSVVQLVTTNTTVFLFSFPRNETETNKQTHKNICTRDGEGVFF